MMEDFFEANRRTWNLRTAAHLASNFYDVENWKKHRNSLNPTEIEEVGEVAGKSLLHLQCHFGQDTLSWAHRGALATGCDLSDAAIDAARRLAADTELSARFVCCNVYDLPQHLDERFDIVFTSYGTIGWLPDLQPWARVVSHFLKPGGMFYMVDFHPVFWMLDDKGEGLGYSYFNSGAIATDNTGTYADRQAPIAYRDYGWNHSMSDLINSLIGAGLRLTFLREFPYSWYPIVPRPVKDERGRYQIGGLEGVMPLMYSLKAEKPD